MATYARKPEDVLKATAESTGDALEGNGVPEPKRSLQECDRIMTAPGAVYEWEKKTIFGRDLRVFKNLPPSLRDFWLLASQAWADREYLVLGDERLTFKETHRRAVVVAAMLAKEYGIKKGDKVAIIMRNRPDWIVCLWAIQLLGAVVVAVNCWLSPEGLVHCIKLSNTVVAIADDERAQQLTPEISKLKQNGLKAFIVAGAKAPSGMVELAPLLRKYAQGAEVPKVALEPEDDASIFFTSGTTGFPKAVLSTHRMFLTNLLTLGVANRRMILRRGEDMPPPPSPDDPQRVLLLPVPFFHVTGCQSFLMGQTATGGKTVLMHKWSQKEGLRLIREEKVNSTGGVPFIAQEVLEAGNSDDLKTLDTLSFGGAPAQEGLPGLIKKHLPIGTIQQSWGLTETNSVAAGHAGEDYHRRPLSTGLAAIVNELRIVDPNGKDVPKPGDIGEILVKGPNVFKEYYNDPKATAGALTPDGWFRTGDLGSLDEDGFLYIRDRAKDIIIRGGENIAATAVENALYRNPKVQDCAVVAVSDAKMGELPAAVVVLRANAGKVTEQDIIEDAKKHLPRHSVPVFVMLRSPKDESSELRIERNPNGKIVKNELKKVVEKEWQKRGGKAKL